MDNRDLPSDSDTSDEDFIPDGVDSDLPSEEESGPDDVELEGGNGSGDETNVKKPKGRKRGVRRESGGRKKRQRKEEHSIPEGQESEEIECENNEKKELSEVEEKKKADSLWADFMKDVGGPAPRKPTVASVVKADTELESTSVKSAKPKQAPAPSTEKENKVTITKIFEFAGEEVRVMKEVAADSAEARLSLVQGEKAEKPAEEPARVQGKGTPRGGLSGISSVLSQIGKKAKISTLEKSKLDWERYKQDQGIEEEIQTHNRGKDGYLEKQDFLQRADLRQFEIEKQMRANRRSNR